MAHAALLVAARHGHRTRLVAVVRGELQQHGVEADRVAAALQDGALEVVVVMWRLSLCVGTPDKPRHTLDASLRMDT